ncbi:LolA family protein [Dethiobacter alkaliphilus]|uniref:Outer membrane lipoprotein-sorting protein n=1 Tax=Dethiobacter alkaliphilus AHT 1 TaxID=555088 RepID=C0GKP3_DETAL|nr:outer membrane lipoprotein carrier protein LolA [Dethiobacter alkaliphilus]EEG76065.1 hypothetical protein DealDRAFT_3052 [Dethiobacter alkaliphilus AHT 1]
MKIKLPVLTVILALIFLAAGCSQPPEEGTLDYVLENVRNNSIDTFTGVMEISSEMDGKTMETITYIWYAGGRSRTESVDEEQHKQITIFDGTDSWIISDYDLSYVTVIREPSGFDMFDFTNFGEPYELSYRGTETVEGRRAHGVEGVLEKDGFKEEVTWWVDAETWLPFISENRTDLYTGKLIFRDIRINKEVDESLLEYTPPEDVYVHEIFPEDRQ